MDSRVTLPMANGGLPAQGGPQVLGCPGDIDAALIRKAEDGDAQAFGQLAAHYDLVILRFLLALTESEDAASELCRRSFVRAYREMRHRPALSMHNWLYRIAVQEWLAAAGRGHSTDSARGAGDAVASPQARLNARETLVLTLKIRQRLALHTVAEILQISHDVAGQTFTRAIYKLRFTRPRH